jgi:hypothetical protein
MGYYHIELSRNPELCTVVLPWGKYEYRNFRWAYVTADVFKKDELFIGMDEVRLHRRFTIMSGTYEEHLAKLDQCFYDSAADSR